MMCRTKLLLSLCVLLLCACTERVDESARYVFRDVTVASYLQKHADYSEYYDLLGRVPVSSRSQSTVMQLLTARGHFTVFAPTNDAIHAYLQSLVAKEKIARPSWDAFPDSVLLDSIRKVIVYNSIIDGKDDTYYQVYDFPQLNNGEFARANMKDLKLSVFYATDPDSIYINRDCPISVRNRDILAINGVVHQMEKVIAPEEETMAGVLTKYIRGEQQGFCVMARLCEACGLMDTLSKIRDEQYEKMYQQGLLPEKVPANGMASMTYGYSVTPEHRKYGFTLFAEPDDFWEEALGKPASDIQPEDVQQWVERQGYYPDGKVNTNYTHPDNLLYQWTTYHILAFKLSPDRLTFHYCEYGYNFQNPSASYTIPVMEYYTTMGERRLLKIYESPESQGIYLNRFPVIDNRRNGTGHEISCDPAKTGARVNREDPDMESHTAVNGFLYAVSLPLAYSTEVRQNLGKERIRMDAMSWFNETLNNDIRCANVNDDVHGWVYFPYDLQYKYIDNLSISEGCTFVYCNGYGHPWGNYCADEIKCMGRWELTFRLPPVPVRGTYEIRYRVISNNNRGVAQLYFGSDPDKLSVTGIPVNLTVGGEDPRTGWRAETDDEDYNAETDKQMHAKGFMKGEKSIDRLNASGANSRANESSHIVRHVVVRRTLDPSETYYMRFKTVLDRTNAEFYMDGLEYCPKEIYDNPNEPEDIW